MEIITLTVLIWICFLAVYVVHIRADCADVAEDSEISVCIGMVKNNISSDIYLNTRLIPRFETYDCECIVKHTYTTLDINIDAEENIIDSSNFYFKIATPLFKNDTNIRLTNEITVIRFQVKSTHKDVRHGCLILKPVSPVKMFSVECLRGNETYNMDSTITPMNRETTVSECGIFTHGINCSLKCGQCKDDSTCDAVTGMCPSGCIAEYTGSLCTTRIESKSNDVVVVAVGCTSAGVVFVIIVVIVVVCYLKRQRNRKEEAERRNNYTDLKVYVTPSEESPYATIKTNEVEHRYENVNSTSEPRRNKSKLLCGCVCRE